MQVDHDRDDKPHDAYESELQFLPPWSFGESVSFSWVLLRLGLRDDQSVVTGLSMPRLGDGDVDEVATLVKVNCHSLPNSDDVFIEPAYRRAQWHSRGQGHCRKGRLGGVLESRIYEAGIDRDGRLFRSPQVQEH